jgi:RHS repeat-associated protein
VPPTPPPLYGATAAEVQARASAATHWEYAREPAVGGLSAITDQFSGRARWALAAPRGPGHELLRVNVDRTTLVDRHDSAGRIVLSGDRTFAYHADGALAVVRDRGNLTEAYVYTADGRLAGTWSAPTVAPDEAYAYDGRHQVASIRPAQGTAWEAVWGVGPDHLLAWTDQPTLSGQQIPLLDQRGSVVASWAPFTARLLGRLDEDPEGRRSVYAPNGDIICAEAGTGDLCPAPGGMPFGLTGGWRSDRTGLVWRGARWYSPPLGQWLTRDPAGMIDGFNTYAYARSDPVNRVDATGLGSQGPAAAAPPLGLGTTTTSPPLPPWPTWFPPPLGPPRSSGLPTAALRAAGRLLNLPLPLSSAPSWALAHALFDTRWRQLSADFERFVAGIRGRGFLDLLGWAYGEDVSARGVSGGFNVGDVFPLGPNTPGLAVRSGRWHSDVPPQPGLRSAIVGPPGVDTYGAWAEGSILKIDVKPSVPDPRPGRHTLGIGHDPATDRLRGRAHSGIGHSLTLGFDASVGGSAGVTLTNDQVQAGYGAGVGAAVAAQTRQRYLRLGLSAGPSALVRLHNSDADADGDREYGFGVDVGPITLDYKTETPVWDLPWILTGFGGALLVGEMLTDDLTDALSDRR